MSDQVDDGADDGAPGWEAINEALKPIYGDQEPLHWGTVIRYSLGGPDPLDGISAYPRQEPTPHWHIVTYGFSELYQKESPDPEYSGFGFELTFRLARNPGEDSPPMWALNFLQNLARYVFETGNVFGPGHHMHLNSPIALDSDTKICAIAFCADPELAEIDTPHGKLAFIQVVGLTDEEYLSVMAWNTDDLLALMAEHIGLLVTDVGRESLLTDPGFRTRVEKGTAEKGSSTDWLYTTEASWSSDGDGGPIQIRFDVNTAYKLAIVLPGRLPFDNPLTAASAEHAVTFEPSETAGLRVEEESHLLLSVPGPAVEDLAKLLRSGVGSFEMPGLPSVTVIVKATIIKDQEGNPVRTIEKYGD